MQLIQHLCKYLVPAADQSRGKVSVPQHRIDMADSKLAPKVEGGLMIAAACFRAKYRLHDGQKVRIRSSELGVHKKNRGGAYPSGLRVQEFLKECARHGVVQEEADHNCSAVEEMPLQEIMLRGGYLPTLDYNIQECAKDDILSGIYAEPHNRVCYSLLAHNHFMTICRAFLAKQLWRLAGITEMNITFCDHEGRLSLSTFAQHTNGEQLQAIINEGFLCEVLSWKMDVEEPEAAVLISTAMNEISSASMRTTELQAIKVLKGEIIIQMNKDVSQKVCFQTVVDRVRRTLGPAVADPELVELFEFLICNGVGKNTYIDDFLDWACVSVNPKRRQLRFAAFSPINKMPDSPRSRVAVAKRAYRGKPLHGFCPNPENQWGSVTMEQILPLEQLLRFFHVQCKQITKDLEPNVRLNLLGQVDIAAAEAFFRAITAKGGKKDANQLLLAVRECLLKATYKLAGDLRLHDASQLSTIDGKPEWIVFVKPESDATRAEQTAVAPAPAKGENIAATASVIQFDEASGQALHASGTEKKKKEPVTIDQAIPWKAWQSVYAEPANDRAADQLAAGAVLQSLSRAYDASSVPLEVCDRHGRIHVRATSRIDAGAFMLPPSVANTCPLVAPSENTAANAVEICVRVRMSSFTADTSASHEQPAESAKKKARKADKKVNTEEELTQAEDLSTRQFKLLPEWKVPPLKPAIVAKATDVTDTVEGSTVWPPTSSRVGAVERSLDDFKWSEPGATIRGHCQTIAALSPYWGIRRVCASALQAANAVFEKSYTKKQSFNCTVQYHKVTNVCVGLVADKPVNVTRIVDVPFITNLIDVEAGEELLLEKPEEQPRAKVPIKGKTWKDQIVKTTKEQAKKG